MVKKKYSEFPPETFLSDAIIPFENGSGTTGRTNPTDAAVLYNILSSPLNTRHVKNQTELEDFLGTDLFIPAFTDITVIIDESFSLAKPFKKQEASSLLLYSQSSNVTLTYTGTGALIQMDGAVIGNRTQIDNITLTGNFTNQCFAVEDNGFFTINLSLLTSWARIGFLKGQTIIWDNGGQIACLGGADFINNPAIKLVDGSNDLGASPGYTLYSLISNINTDFVMTESIDTSQASDEYLFLDPNSPSTSSYTIKDSGIFGATPDSLFQKGVDVAVTAVADNGSGAIRCTATAHGQVNNTYAVLSGFSESTYNKTALITVIDVNTFDVEEIAFVADDSGNINRGSLDSTSVRVLAEDNPDQRDSMFIASAGLEIFGSEISSSSLAQNAFEEITSGSWLYNKLERFSIGVSTEGQVVADDISLREYDVKYSATIEKSGGGAVDIGIILIKNGSTEIAFNPPHTVNAGKIQISGDDLIELVATDTLKVAVKNYDSSTATILISQVSLVISKG